MRVVAGSARGRKLKAPRGMETRPTADRVKESIFNVLSSRLIATRVLDLFAGTGSLGIEALSRGADHAVFVEDNPRVIQIIRENVEAAGFVEKATVLRREAIGAIAEFQRSGEKFDLAFADPPYQKGWVSRVMQAMAAGPILAPGGVLVLEHTRREPAPQLVGALVLSRQLTYGDTVVSLYQEEVFS